MDSSFPGKSPATHSSRFDILLQEIAPYVYLKIRLASYSFGDAFNEEAHRQGVFRHEDKKLYDDLKEETRKHCDNFDPFLTIYAWTRSRDNHKVSCQKFPLTHRTRLKPGIETEVEYPST
jgi:hypothetical protein